MFLKFFSLGSLREISRKVLMLSVRLIFTQIPYWFSTNNHVFTFIVTKLVGEKDVNLHRKQTK